MKKEIERNYLEISSINDLNDTNFCPEGYRVEFVNPTNFQINKFFYKNIGKKHRWVDRLVWDNLKWTSYLENQNVQTYVLKLNQDFVGYFELIQDSAKKSHEIAYFGIIEDYIGKKFGGYLLSEAIKISLHNNFNRVWVHTCTLDHENAIKNYLSRGMKIFKEQTINLNIN